jgi:Fe-S cluster assembly protein SufB
VDFNFGAKATMKYPSVFLVGAGARADILSMAFAGSAQHQDAGAKVMHVAPNTSSRVISKSVAAYGGRTSFRGMVYVGPKALNSKVHVQCDALILDKESRSDTYPTMRILTDDAAIEHEATVSRIGEQQLFYLQSRGISPERAQTLLVNGFIEPLVKELPMEYAVEMNRLIELEMEGSVG